MTSGAYCGRQSMTCSSAPQAARRLTAGMNGRSATGASSATGGAGGAASAGESLGSMRSAVRSCGAEPPVALTVICTPSPGPVHTRSAPPRPTGPVAGADAPGAGEAFPRGPAGTRTGSRSASPAPTVRHALQAPPGVWWRTATLTAPTWPVSRQVTPTALKGAVEVRVTVSVRLRVVRW
ncbi:hypothetical protein ACPPVO_56130 [Dactylosporangium sp. McL0621]|uniref:hypothetical protein n=1 Tax=Dactylosporangium sp. McL0621 TaxID=3415678 RepID=UPI003CE6C96F